MRIGPRTRLFKHLQKPNQLKFARRHAAVMSSLHAAMSLDEIVHGATVRFTVIDGIQYLSIRDMIIHMCGVNVDYAGQIWRRMSDDHKSELQPFCKFFQFPGRGQSEQPVITFPGAIKLSMFIPGNYLHVIEYQAYDPYLTRTGIQVKMPLRIALRLLASSIATMRATSPS